ncbi:MAG: DUF6941 family protein [Acidiferrobacter sp.]
MTQGRSVTAIYCDDIRQEVGNKASYMGTYTGLMLVPSLPITIPKLMVAVNVYTPQEQPFESLKIQLTKNDDLLSEMQIPEEALRSQASVPMADLGEEVSVVFSFIFNLTPLPVADLSKIRIRVQTESEELKGPALVIKGMEANSAKPAA